jgi:hypothetical protein
MAFTDAEKQNIVDTIRTYMARERISRDEFARRAKLGKSTIDKLVTGLFSERTILHIEARLNIRLRATEDREGAIAPAEFGAYTREEGSYFLGEYTFARPSFHEEGVIQVFHMEILWGSNPSVLQLRERARTDGVTPQMGAIHIPRGSGHLFILSNENGWLQTTIVTQLNVLKRMKGIMATMGHAFGSVYLPAAVPVVLSKVDKVEPRMIGRVARGSAMFDHYHAELSSVEADSFAKWIRP